MRARRDDRAPEAGFALLMVLLTLGFLSLIVSRGLADARLETQLAQAAGARAQDDASLDSGLQTTLFHLVTPGHGAWSQNGRHVLTAGGTAVMTVRTTLLIGLIPLNDAGPTILSGLFQACGLPEDKSLALARNVIAWHDPASAATAAAAYQGAAFLPPGTPFRDIADLAYVQGMTPALMRCVSPHVSIYQHDVPRADARDPVVRAALRLSQTAAIPGQAGSDAESADGFAGSSGPVAGSSQVVAPIGGPTNTVTRIDLDFVRDTVHRHVSVIAELAAPSEPAPYRLVAWRPDAAPDLR